MDPPSTPAEFTAWSTQDTCGVFDNDAKSWFTSGQNNLWAVLQDSAFAAELNDTLAQARDGYRARARAELFALGALPTVRWDRKSYDSVVDKLYRLNRVENPSFPDPPKGGWIRIADAFTELDDIVRTTIYVGYADSPEFVAEQIEASAKRHTLNAKVKPHAKEKGYYAHHVYVEFPLPIADLTTKKYVDIRAKVEVQVATQLQAALREVTHVLYEKERLQTTQDAAPVEWKSDFASGRFRAAYMAHSLRFIEAMIVDLRDNILREAKKP